MKIENLTKFHVGGVYKAYRLTHEGKRLYHGKAAKIVARNGDDITVVIGSLGKHGKEMPYVVRPWRNLRTMGWAERACHAVARDKPTVAFDFEFIDADEEIKEEGEK